MMTTVSKNLPDIYYIIIIPFSNDCKKFTSYFGTQSLLLDIIFPLALSEQLAKRIDCHSISIGCNGTTDST